MNQQILIALNGRPGSGKSAVQDILKKVFNVHPHDDGQIIREHCMDLFGLTWFDVSTQEGKAGHKMINGKKWQVRQILGEYGSALESVFGEETVPAHAVRTAKAILDAKPELRGMSFGSVRRNQGKVYREAGGVVVEIVRPGVALSGNVWDKYNKSYVTHTFVNDAPNLERLEGAVREFFLPMFSQLSETV